MEEEKKEKDKSLGQEKSTLKGQADEKQTAKTPERTVTEMLGVWESHNVEASGSENGGKVATTFRCSEGSNEG